MTICIIDLNYLKQINDTYGHEKGDLALINTAALIRKVFGDNDSYRFGGDEFISIIYNTEEIPNLASKFNKLMMEDTREEKWEHISAALGYAIFDKDKDNTLSDIFERADKLMYENKKEMKSKLK